MVVSILVPSVLPFLEYDNDILITMDLTDEESKKEHKKELNEKEVFFQEVSDNVSLEELSSHKLFNHYLASLIEVPQEIFLPPPEHKA